VDTWSEDGYIKSVRGKEALHQLDVASFFSILSLPNACVCFIQIGIKEKKHARSHCWDHHSPCAARSDGLYHQEQAVLSGGSESELPELIQERLLLYRRKYIVFGPLF